MGLPGVQRLRLTTADQQSIEVSLIGVFERGDERGDADAPTFRNMARVVFNTVPQASRVVLVNTNRGIPLFLVEVAHRWFDVTAKPVRVRAA